jgi:ferredoxin
VVDVIDSTAHLPSGWGVETGPGTYRLRRREDAAAFGHSAGPQAWKRFLHPPRERLLSVDGSTFEDADEQVARYAFLGVRACDLRAIAVLDRVLGSSGRYARRRRATLLVAVNCTEPSATCFCVSAGGGPDASALGVDVDLVLTELLEAGLPRYVAEAGSDAGRRILGLLRAEPAPPEVVSAARDAVAAAIDHMGRSLPDVDLHRMLAETLDSSRWDEVAARCLTCANCTMVCPTCFCTSVTDTTDVSGDHAERWQRWASCFELEYSYLHGGAVRTSGRSRYRQWLTHKLGTWHDQFGESGCVGCGRCIAWCPVGIDITAEARALAADWAEARP